MEEAGIRRLKSHLSEYIRRVRRGESLVITDRGTPVALLTPIRSSMSSEIEALLESGSASWQRGKPGGARTPPAVRGADTVSSFVSEDRR